METGDKIEHQDACKLEKEMMKTSDVAERAQKNHHLIQWVETPVLSYGVGHELMTKEVLHIQMTASEDYFNQDVGLEVPS